MSKGFKLDYKGVAALMKSSEMVAVLDDHAQRIKQNAGDGYETSTHVGKTRANVSVRPVSHKARRDNMKNNTLLKAVRK